MKPWKKNTWYYILLSVGALFTIIFLFDLARRRHLKKEGFTQHTRYILKRNEEIYDDFYVDIYETVYCPPTYTEAVVKAIENNTQASAASVFLDIGAKTGAVVDLLHRRGFQAYGVEPQEALVSAGERRHPEVAASCSRGDPLDPLLFERGSFSHILCLHDTIYYYQDKIAFLRHCYFWLKTGGVLVLQVYKKPPPTTAQPACNKPARGGGACKAIFGTHSW